MTTSSKEDCYPICKKCCGTGWTDIAPVIEDKETLALFADKLHLHFLPDLAKLERGMKRVAATHLPENVDERSVNPTLLLLNLSWKNLSAITEGNLVPERGDERLLLWKDRSSRLRVKPATDERLLALKVVLEELDTATVAREGGVATIVVEELLRQAAAENLLLLPPSKIRRSGPDFDPAKWPEEVLAARTFCLQWHLTNRCDLSCRHCYDRTDRGSIPPERGLAILHELNDFCRSRNVSGHVSFTGGNPFLHPDFVEIYRHAAQLGLSAAILGNPVSREKLQEIMAILPPSYFQVSLEGLQEHNDGIRGEGNFDAVLAFLDLLKECGIYSVVMLTLTHNNLREVLPLAEHLENRASAFTFNRLASFGAGKSLEPADPAEYRSFLEKYLSTWKKRSILGRKDNLLNLIHREQNEELFDGCTGFGCGAAFSFLSLLPDGEVHACRKFPSPIGNAFTNSLEDIYESPIAERYRAGSAGCAGCDIRAVCGGCPAVTAGAGRDPLNDRDPYCFHPAKNSAYT